MCVFCTSSVCLSIYGLFFHVGDKRTLGRVIKHLVFFIFLKFSALLSDLADARTSVRIYCSET